MQGIIPYAGGYLFIQSGVLQGEAVNTEVSHHISALSEAMRADPAYAWSWQCNLAMMTVDAGAPRSEANGYAATFLKNVFDIDVRSLCSDYWEGAVSEQ